MKDSIGVRLATTARQVGILFEFEEVDSDNKVLEAELEAHGIKPSYIAAEKLSAAMTSVLKENPYRDSLTLAAERNMERPTTVPLGSALFCAFRDSCLVFGFDSFEGHPTVDKYVAGGISDEQLDLIERLILDGLALIPSVSS